MKRCGVFLFKVNILVVMRLRKTLSRITNHFGLSKVRVESLNDFHPHLVGPGAAFYLNGHAAPFFKCLFSLRRAV